MPKEQQVLGGPKSEKPKLRVMVEEACVVLRLRSLKVAKGSNEWTQRRQARAFAASPEDYVDADGYEHQDEYLHVGYVNFKTWLWTVQPLTLVDVADHGILTLQSHLPLTCSRSFEFFQNALEFEHPCFVKIYKIRSTLEDLARQDTRPCFVTVDEDLEHPHHCFWRGLKTETTPAQPPLRRQAPSRRSRPARGQGRGRPRLAVPRLQQPARRHAGAQDAAEPEDCVSEDEEDVNADAGGVGDIYMDAGDMDMDGLAVSEDDADMPDFFLQNVEEEIEEQDRPEQVDELLPWPAPGVPEAAEAPAADAAASASARPPARPAAAAPQGVADPAAPARPAAAAPQGVADPAAAAAAPEPPPPEAAREGGDARRARAPGLLRDRATCTLLVPNRGTIRYYEKSQSMVAFCDRCAGDCRKSRTVKANAQRPSQGRPLGFLLAWLEAAEEYGGRAADHNVLCLPLHAARVAARNDCRALLGYDVLAGKERRRADGEAEEPL